MSIHYYSPHPGSLGATKRIPEPVRIIANKLCYMNNVSIEQAIEMIEDACPDGDFHVEDCGDYIGLTEGNWDDLDKCHIPMHSWRVIRYREIKELHNAEEN